MSHVLAYDPAGQLLAVVAPGYAERAIARREAARVPGRRDAIALRPSAAVPIRELTPDEKRRIVLAKERANR